MQQVQLTDGGYRLEQTVELGDVRPEIALTPENFQQYALLSGAHPEVDIDIFREFYQIFPLLSARFRGEVFAQFDVVDPLWCIQL